MFPGFYLFVVVGMLVSLENLQELRELILVGLVYREKSQHPSPVLNVNIVSLYLNCFGMFCVRT